MFPVRLYDFFLLGLDMAKTKLLLIMGIIVAAGVAVTIVIVPLILTHRGKISPQSTTTTTTTTTTTSFGMFVL
jgi:hypothetical protein